MCGILIRKYQLKIRNKPWLEEELIAVLQETVKNSFWRDSRDGKDLFG